MKTSLAEKIFFIVGFFLCSPILFYSQKEANNWYFGNGCGLNFATSPPTVLSGSPINTLEGCASISDENGELLFYTGSSTFGVSGVVYDKTHSVMPNGNDLLGGGSSTQQAIITPVIGNKNQYFIFTTNGITSGSTVGLSYSVVDMSLPGNGTTGSPLGDVSLSSKNIPLIDSTGEKVTAIRHADGINYWVVASGYFSNTYYAFLVTCNGVKTTPKISTFSISASVNGGRGCMKASFDGKTIIAALSNNAVYAFDFNNSTGQLSNPINIDEDDLYDFYGVEFSPNDSLIYIAGSVFLAPTQIFQYQRYSTYNKSEITYSQAEIGPSGLQLATDGKIYITVQNNNTLDVIDNPNSISSANITTKAVILSGTCNFGLPNFFNIYLKPKLSILGNDTSINCVDNQITLKSNVTGSSYEWLPSNVSSTSSMNVSESGIYWLNVTDEFGCIASDTIVVDKSCNNDSLNIPNIFTPNGDNINDQFIVFVVGQKNLTFKIYNRWGNVVFETTDGSIYWDGKISNGKDAPDGTYFYSSEVTFLTDKTITQSGSLQLIRSN